MNSVPKLFSYSYADCWTEKHFSTEFGVLTLNHTHSHTLFWGCVSRWFGRALAWHARGHRFDPGILHHKDLSENSGRSFFTYSIISASCMQRTHPLCHTPRKTPRHAGRCPARGAGRPASARRGLQPLNCPA